MDGSLVLDLLPVLTITLIEILAADMDYSGQNMRIDVFYKQIRMHISYMVIQLISKLIVSKMHQRKTLGIFRNKTEMLKLCKEARRKKQSRFAKGNLSGITEAYRQEDHTIKQQFIEQQMMPTMPSLPPQWVDKYEDCLSTIRKIDEIKKRILTQQNRRLTSIRISDQKEAQRTIYELSSAATSMIRKCEKNIEEIKKHSRQQSKNDQKTCRNICMGLAMTLQEKTKQLRAQQRAFMEQRKHIQDSTKVSFLQMAAQKVLEDDYFEDEAEKMDELELKVNEERNKQILKIVESIHQLNDLYKELNNLVIVQGSLLDRIDLNIDESVFHVKKGTDTLVRVDERQKKSKCACRMMAVMIIGVVILGVILIVRWTN